MIAQNRRVVVFGEAPSSCCSAVPRRCDAERGRLPNLVAVDFYGRGDLFDVVRTLNGLK